MSIPPLRPDGPGDPDEQQQQDPGLTLRVTSRPAPAAGSGYMVELTIGDDLAWVLDEPAAVRYARQVLWAAQTANHEAAVYNQARTRLGLSIPDAAQILIRWIRPDRRPADHAATKPVEFLPGVNSAGDPFVEVFVRGEDGGRVTAAVATLHAVHVLETAATVELDAAYARYLTSQLGLDPDKAAVCVDDLAAFRRPTVPTSS